MRSVWILFLFGSLITYHCFTTVSGEGVPSTEPQPSFDQCKPYVEAALKTGSQTPETDDSSSSETAGAQDAPPGSDEEDDDKSTGEQASDEQDDSKESAEDSKEADADDNETEEDEAKSAEQASAEDESKEADDSDSKEVDSKEEEKESAEGDSEEDTAEKSGEQDDESEESAEPTSETPAAEDAESEESNEDEEPKAEGSQEESNETDEKSGEVDDEAESEEGEDQTEEDESEEGATAETDSKSDEGTAEGEGATDADSAEDSGEENKSDGSVSDNVADEADESESTESQEEQKTEEDQDSTEDASTQNEAAVSSEEDDGQSEEADKKDVDEQSEEDSKSQEDGKSEEDGNSEEDGKSVEDGKSEEDEKSEEDGKSEEDSKSEEATVADEEGKSDEDGKSEEDVKSEEDGKSEEDEKSEEDTKEEESEEVAAGDEAKSDEDDDKSGEESDEESEEEDDEDKPEPYEPRSRSHITEILGLDGSDKTKNLFTLLDQATQTTLKDLKRIYESAIKPLETLYKYRDLSNRHFGDPEIFSKPLVVFMGPWSGGKSTIINWLLDIQNEETALRTGADPSPGVFNIMMHGKEDEVLDGTQLAADWTFSGLQKFGQSFLDRLRGRKMPNRLLEKVNIVEIPGILEVRKQVERSFPFNDACQWFIDRADVLFLVYDPAKLDIGPETEAILDQLKGRENQVRIVLNKADSVKPDELMRVQATLVWNISPLMSSAEPPVMYAASLWDRPLQPESPKSLLVSHEHNFLKDIRDGTEKRVETRIAAARRFAVRVRNHAKMVDCYINTYNNHRSFFSDKKKVSNDIIDHPQNYHIYEGLSTLTNISRYDLPDPDTYRDFFKLNPLWEFPALSSTCSYMRGCPINKLDIAIAYELPEILGKFRRQREAILTAQSQKSTSSKK